MKFTLKNRYLRWGITAFLVVAASICFYYLVFHASSISTGVRVIFKILMPVVIGFVTAYLLTPVLNYIEFHIFRPLCKKINIKETPKRNSLIRGISILITLSLAIFLIYVLISMMLSQIVPSVVNIISNFDIYINNFTRGLTQLLEDNPEMGEYVTRMVSKYSEELELWLNNTVLTKTSDVIRTVSLSVIGVLTFLWDFIIGFVISVYVLASKEKFAGQAKKITYAFFQRNTANTIIRNFRFTHRTFIGYISGKIIDSIIIGILCFVGTSILNTPYAALVSVIIGVTNVIPFFGPYLGAIPSTILIFVVEPTQPLNCVYFALFILILQQFDGNILGPKILGESTGLTGFWVIFAITFFGGLFGVLGMVVGVPIFAVIYAAVKSIVNTQLQRKQMPLDTEKYLDVGLVDDEGFHVYTPEAKSKKRSTENEEEHMKAHIKDSDISPQDTAGKKNAYGEDSASKDK